MRFRGQFQALAVATGRKPVTPAARLGRRTPQLEAPLHDTCGLPSAGVRSDPRLPRERTHLPLSAPLEG